MQNGREKIPAVHDSGEMLLPEQRIAHCKIIRPEMIVKP